MSAARSAAEWDRMSALMALIANCNRDPKRHRPFKPADFDPYAKIRAQHDKATGQGKKKAGVAILKAVFCKKDNGQGKGQGKGVVKKGRTPRPGRRLGPGTRGG